MKNTKIICTVGPSSDNYSTLKSMYEAGINVARINMSHGSAEQHQKTIDLVKQLRNDLGKPLGLMLDTKGPELRIGSFENGKVELVEGANFVFTTDDVVGNENIVSVTYSNLHNELKKGDQLLVNDGLLTFEVIAIDGTKIQTQCLVGGTLSDKKGIHTPGVHLNLPFLSDKDKSDLMLAINNDADFVAASFVNCAQNVVEMREFLESNGLLNCKIIAKIESQLGVTNINEILEAADGVMVARGDLGVELEFCRLPKIQKDIIKLAKAAGKDVIVATEMLESMITKNRPTRAEISDVANAVYDETSAVMLSGETAMGKYPVKVVKTMETICKYVESTIAYEKRFKTREVNEISVTDTISHSTCSIAMQLSAKAIVVATESGKTARRVSKFRPSVPIIAIVSNLKTTHQLSLTWGVTAIENSKVTTIQDLIDVGQIEMKKLINIEKDDKFVIVAGVPMNQKGSTNLLRVERVNWLIDLM